MNFFKNTFLSILICITFSCVKSYDIEDDQQEINVEFCIIKKNDTIHAGQYIDAYGDPLDHHCILVKSDTIHITYQNTYAHGDQVDDPAGPE